VVGISTFSAAPPACEGSDLQWSVSAQNATSYRWEVDLGNGFQTLSAGNGVSGVDGPSLILTNAGSEWHTALLRCVVSGACGEVVSPSAAVYLNGTPVITAQPQDIQVCSGGSLSLNVQAEGNGIAYHWQLRNAEGIFEPPLNEPPFQGTQSAVLTVEAVAEVQGFVLQCVVSGCGISLVSDTARISILENNPVYIPNAFSPDGDLVNPVWQAYTEGNPQMETLIYNRWGELLHSWKGIDGFWDGTYLQAPVQEGIYVYRIAVETECETRKYMGNFQLLR
jgi:gliding motility-associated-like protein